MRYLVVFSLFVLLMSCQGNKKPAADANAASDTMRFANEKHLKNIKMLTMEGENAEAYFSFDNNKLIFQSTHGSYQCDQIFTMNTNGENKKLVSTGYGRTTCSYFLPGDEKIIYASTHLADTSCPAPPDFSKGYVWKVYKTFDLIKANADGSNPEVFLPAEGYDAEATISPMGDKIVFTSQRDGDLDIYTCNLDGSDLKRLTTELGYDGGPFFSWDGQKIVYRSYHPKTDEEIKRYKDLLDEELIEPNNFQVWVMNADGSNKHQVTDNDFANFAPFFHPDNNRIIFCSNLNSTDKRRPDFNLWLINEDGTGLEQVTYFDQFDGFPMWTKDGKKLVFASNRFNKNPRDTNVFLADWVD
ncbi:MAG: PD40 domain-containing protein [Calditrichae bacterium]|nr:PD40 domain-containing protein [Calditrichia bacterium]